MFLWQNNNLDSVYFSGSRSGEIILHDQRQSEGHQHTVRLSGHHGREVCGLTYSEPYLASGGDDGLVNIWDLRMNNTCVSISAHTECAKVIFFFQYPYLGSFVRIVGWMQPWYHEMYERDNAYRFNLAIENNLDTDQPVYPNSLI